MVNGNSSHYSCCYLLPLLKYQPYPALEIAAVRAFALTDFLSQVVLSSNITEQMFSFVVNMNDKELLIRSPQSGNKKLAPRTVLHRVRDGAMESTDKEGCLTWSFQTGKETILMLQKDRTLVEKVMREVLVEERCSKLARHSSWAGSPPAKFTVSGRALQFVPKKEAGLWSSHALMDPPEG